MSVQPTTSTAQSAPGAETNCASEPIHIPGGIQPHGYLFCVNDVGLVLQASANVEDIAGKPVAALLGQHLCHIIGEPAEPTLAKLNDIAADGVPVYVGTITVEGRQRGPMAIVVHRHDGANIVELEPAQSTHDVYSSMYPLVRTFINRLQQATTVQELAALAVSQIHAITGMGRTMVYSFDEEDNGHVIAEAVAPGYADYLGQRFPASDIPAQARALYVRNRIRLIADADYLPAPLLPALHPVSGRPTDLTFASLRSVSPVHVQYMKNMGTWASMSMSIVVRGRLWGLISCHHAEARTPSFEVRAACEHIAQVLSLWIEAKEDHADTDYRLTLRARQARLLAAMANTEDFVDALADDPQELLKLSDAAGAAIVFDGRIVLVGAAPPRAMVERLVAWLDTNTEDIYATDRLSSVWDGAVGNEAHAAGMLAVSVSRLFRNYLIWFRPEVVRTIRWAGDPRAKLAGLAASLSPRESFEAWTQTVSGRAVPWRSAEVESAHEFRGALLGIVLRRAEELAQLALELGRANRELEGFSYTVSHDLRAPLRHIVGFADLLGQMESERLSERGNHFLDRIKAQARFGGKLVDDLLAFSQMGRAALRPQRVDMQALVKTLIAEETRDIGERQIEWRVGSLTKVTADAVLMHVVLRNLIANAVKFTGKQPTTVIEVGCRSGEGELDGQDILFVRDNGVGFDMRFVDKLFGVFQRLHRFEDFPGTGIGLASVRRIVERHGGTTWADGETGVGATLSFSLPRVAATDSAQRQETVSEAAARFAAFTADQPYRPILKDMRPTDEE